MTRVCRCSIACLVEISEYGFTVSSILVNGYSAMVHFPSGNPLNVIQQGVPRPSGYHIMAATYENL